MTENWHQKYKNQNRIALIAAAKELFLKQSFLSTSVKDICSAAGISRVTFYKHFQSMNELVMEVLVEILEEMTRFVKSSADQEMNGRQKLVCMLDAWVRYASEQPSSIKFIVLFDLHFEAADVSDSFKDYYSSLIKRGKEEHFLLDALKDGVADGTLKAKMDLLQTAQFIFVAMMGLLQKISLAPEEEGVTHQNDLLIINRFVDMLVQHVSV